MEQDNTSISQIIERILGVIIAFFSSLIYLRIQSAGDANVEVTLIVTIAFLIWIVIKTYVAVWLTNIWFMEINKKWIGVIFKIGSFLTILGLFLVYQFLIGSLSEAWNQSNFNVPESIVAIFVIMSLMFVVYQNFLEIEH